MLRRLISFLPLFLLFVLPALESRAQENLPVPIRPALLECNTLLNPKGMSDGMGIPLSTGGVNEFDAALGRLLETSEPSSLAGSHLYVTGIEMGEESAIQRQYEAILERHGIKPGSVTVKVLSAPRSLLARQVTPALRDAWSRLQYFFPSMKRDFQKPLPMEILTGVMSTVPLELPNAVFLMKNLPHPDASIVLGVHSATLFAYTVFSQTLLNWLLRPGTNRMELFLKQCLMSFPFILNYRVFGHFSELMGVVQAKGYSELIRQSPSALADFVATDGFTILLQTVFYSSVITKGAGEWVNGQIVEINRNAARTMRPVVQAPILIVDALLLAYATTSQNVLFQIGPLDFNDGHALLIGLTGIGWAAYRPAVLDFIGIRPYFAIERLMKRLREVFSFKKS